MTGEKNWVKKRVGWKKNWKCAWVGGRVNEKWAWLIGRHWSSFVRDENTLSFGFREPELFTCTCWVLKSYKKSSSKKIRKNDLFVFCRHYFFCSISFALVTNILIVSRFIHFLFYLFFFHNFLQLGKFSVLTKCCFSQNVSQ